MNPDDIANAKDPDLQGALVALKRAAQQAREIAIQTNTGIVVVKDGKIVHLSADELRQEALQSKNEVPTATDKTN